jgi:3-oxoadipate enol-lactonase
MPFANVSGGGRIYWKLEGLAEAPALVLLNSIGTDMDLWDGMLPALRARFAVLRIDTRGHGASAAPPGDYDLAMLADDVRAVMDQAEITTAAVAGVSLGGMIAMELALAAPARISALALICTSAVMDAAAWNDRIMLIRRAGMASIADLAMGRFLSPAFIAAHPDIAATVRRQLLAMDPAGYAGCGAAIRDMAVAALLSRLACPILVVTGTRDTSTPLAGHGDLLLQHLPTARHVAIEAAHLAPLEAPDALVEALVDFLPR